MQLIPVREQFWQGLCSPHLMRCLWQLSQALVVLARPVRGLEVKYHWEWPWYFVLPFRTLLLGLPGEAIVVAGI